MLTVFNLNKILDSRRRSDGTHYSNLDLCTGRTTSNNRCSFGENNQCMRFVDPIRKKYFKIASYDIYDLNQDVNVQDRDCRFRVAAYRGANVTNDLIQINPRS